MNFVKIENSCAILRFSDTTIEHKTALADIDAILKLGFTCFVFDFYGVKKFSSSVLGFILGVIRIIKNHDCRVYVRNLSDETRQMLQYSVKLIGTCDELKEFLSLEDLQSVELGGSDGN